jgi:TatD DNase family protein
MSTVHPIIDIGANLTNPSLIQDLEQILQRASDVGISTIVVTGTDLKESEKAIQLCTQHPQQLVCTEVFTLIMPVTGRQIPQVK